MPHELSVRLCQLVQHYPELYDSLNERFHDDEAKNSAWRKVAWCLEVPQSECDEIKIKWKKIRHQFVKAKKERNTSWDLWPYLQFLSEAEARSIPEKSPQKRKASTTTADSPRFLKEVVSGKHASNSEAAGPSPKRLRMEGSGADAYSQGSQATEHSAVLDKTFLEQLQKKFARLRPDIRGTMKATILEMLDGAAR
ncbi:uncharacterized protein LOC144098844 isoform X1 [Amblyomma americanum]